MAQVRSGRRGISLLQKTADKVNLQALSLRIGFYGEHLNLLLPTCNKKVPPAGNSALTSLIFSPSTDTPPWLMRRRPSEVPPANPAATMTLGSHTLS